MAQMFVVGEDELCCALGQRLVKDVLGWDLSLEPINTKGITKLRASLPRYLDLARHRHVLCVADTDRRCALDLLRDWLPNDVPERFQLRLAVTEAESWLLADREAAAEFLHVRAADIPERPDEVQDAKRTLLWLARRSRRRDIRSEVVSPQDPNRPGPGYNLHMRNFLLERWRPETAATGSPSLARAVSRLQLLASDDA